MIVDCHSCGATYNISDDKVRGRRVRVRCKSCGEGIIVDGAQLAAEDATRVYSPNFEPAAYGGTRENDESTRVMSAPSDLHRLAPDAGDEWTVNLSETEQRTMSTEELVRGYHGGSIGDDAFVWRDGMSDWLPVLDVPELRSAVEASEATRVVSPAAAVRAPLGRGGTGSLPAPPIPPPPVKVTPPPPAPQAVAYSAPAAPPRAAQWSPAAEATVEYVAARPPPAPSAFAPQARPAPAARAAPPARVREGRQRGPDLFGGGRDAAGEDALLNSSSMPLAQYEEKPIGARNENSVLFSLDTLKAGARRGPSTVPPRFPQASAPTAADILGLSAGGALPGMDTGAALLSAPAVEAPVPVFAPEPQSRSRMDTTPPTSRGKIPLVVVGLVVLGACAVAGGAFMMFEARQQSASPAASVSRTTATTEPNALPSAAVPPAPVATQAAPASPVATVQAAPEPARVAPEPVEARPAPVEPAPGRPTAPSGARDERSAEQAKIEAMKEALRANAGPKPDKADTTAPQKLVLAEDNSSPGTGGSDTPAAPPDEPPKPPFDTSAARAALDAAASNAASCKKDDGPTGRGKVQITFSPSGRATSATVVEGPFGGTATGGCVARTFRAAHVPAFSGDAVTVSKSFTIPE